MISRDKDSGRGATCYKITVRSELSERFVHEFEGMSLKVENGRTILVGPVIDQSHLHGLLDRIQDLGVELLSVEALPESKEGDVTGSKDGDFTGK
jgi:hypothetical protein